MLKFKRKFDKFWHTLEYYMYKAKLFETNMFLLKYTNSVLFAIPGSHGPVPM